MTTFGDVAYKRGWEVLYEGADRYGVREWSYSNSYESLTLIVTISAVRVVDDQWVCESFAGVSSDSGFTREAISRRAATSSEFEDSVQFAEGLLQPAFWRAARIAEAVHAAASEGRTELLENRFITRRPLPDLQ